MKETKKQIEANLRNKICKSYTQQIESYKKRIDYLLEELKKIRQENYDLRIRNEELEQEKIKDDEWIERLQEFCNMNEEERKIEIEKTKYNTELNQNMNNIFKMYSKIFNVF